jgi:Fur family peroxide stress response transcriptional regulator
MRSKHITGRLSEAGLKITPQCIAVLEAVMQLRNHPTAENVIEFIKTNHPNIAQVQYTRPWKLSWKKDR